MAIDAAPLYNRQAEYQAPLHQERIELLVSANGVEQFIFDAPARIAAVEVESARLLPWDEVEEIVKTGLRIRNLWDYEDENVAVDESGVRTAYAACSVLTVNAIDGSIIDRQMGF